VAETINYTSIQELLKGDSGRKVNLIGTVVEHRKPDLAITANHGDESFKGRLQVVLSDNVGTKI
jgi:hypothetical protein